MSGDVCTVPVPKGYRVGPWEVHEPLASGAFGSVYAARRIGDGNAPGDRTDDGTGPVPRDAALKFLPTGTRTPRQLHHLRELADREQELLNRLRAPRLIRMYQALTVDDPGHPELDGATVLVLERAEGSLAELLDRSPTPGSGPALLAQVCEGLHQLHRAGWVHGDLKLANVALLPEDRVGFIDWQMTLRAPVAVDLGWFLVSNSSSLPGRPESILAEYRQALEWDSGRWGFGGDANDFAGLTGDWDAQLDLTWIVGLLLRGWRKGLDAEAGVVLASRSSAADDLAWWCGRAVEAAERRL